MLRIVLASLLIVSATPAARAAEPLYESRLLRLAEILGSLHFLRTLCGEEGGAWRGQMEALLASENPAPERRLRLVAGFNRGYRSFDAIYSTCTSSATESIARYVKEGEELSRDIAVRFGN